MEKHSRSEQSAAAEAPRQGDLIKGVLAALILAGGLVFYYLRPDLHALIRVGIVLAAVVVAGYLFYLTETGRRWAAFLSDTRKELRLVVWPVRREVVQTTIMILIVVLIMGVFLWLIDMFFLWAVQALTGRGG